MWGRRAAWAALAEDFYDRFPQDVSARSPEPFLVCLIRKAVPLIGVDVSDQDRCRIGDEVQHRILIKLHLIGPC